MVQSSGALRADVLHCCDTWLKLVQDSGFLVMLSVRENLNMLHKISTGRREMGDNSFLRDFRARMLSSRRAMLRSMILRVSFNGSPAEPKVLVSSGEKSIEFRRSIKKHTYLETCNLFSTCRTRRDKCIPQYLNGRWQIMDYLDATNVLGEKSDTIQWR